MASCVGHQQQHQHRQCFKSRWKEHKLEQQHQAQQFNEKQQEQQKSKNSKEEIFELIELPQRQRKKEQQREPLPISSPSSPSSKSPKEKIFELIELPQRELQSQQQPIFRHRRQYRHISAFDQRRSKSKTSEKLNSSLSPSSSSLLSLSLPSTLSSPLSPFSTAASGSSSRRHLFFRYYTLFVLHFNGVVALLFTLILFNSQNVANGEGNVGCHFVRTLCLDGREVCFNDNIFGKCIPTTGVDVEDIERTPLTEDQSRALATMLEEMQGAGLGWDHPYVQCRIQGALYTLQKQAQLPPNLCANLAPTPTDIDPASAMAFVRFTPPNEDYIDRLYYPKPLKKKQVSADGINTIFHQLQLQDRQLRHDPMELAHFGKMEPKLLPPSEANVMDMFLENERTRIEREEEEREAEREAAQKNAMRNRLELYQMLAASEPDPQPYQRKATTMSAMEELEKVVESAPAPLNPSYATAEELAESHEQYFPEFFGPLKRGNKKKLMPNNVEIPSPSRSFFRELAAEEGLEQLQPIIDRAQADEFALPAAFKRVPIDDSNQDLHDDNSDDELKAEQRLFEEGLMRNSLTPFEEEAMLASNAYPRKHKQRAPERVFTEGGLVYVPEDQLAPSNGNDVDEAKKEKARELLANMLGFTRHERLDVKKPGPLIGPPPLQLHDDNNGNGMMNDQASSKSKSSSKVNKAETKEVLPAHIKGSDEAHKKKKVVKTHSDEDHAPHTVDTEYAHVYVKNRIDSWDQGVRIMNALAKSLSMQGYFSYLTVQPHQVSFRVDSNNPEHKTASDIARAINENGIILQRLGYPLISAGVGDKIKSEDDSGVSASHIELAEQGLDIAHVMAYMFAGAGAAAVIVIFVTLILIKRNDKKRDKLGGLQSGGAAGAVESSSKDYQDLCRARMAGKGSAAEPVPSGRITSLSKENEQRTPSSRSSTSSWCEEPALTNMDISTGHMVLSYMEDHLRNKGRLQREWEALCRYEAEPSARDAALEPQCASFNRTGAPLPYDHSRVVLNHLANAEGLDYINASTITDHDPRAPAYVAAQGPLPTTLAHFWQMIWEQGAVVIVSLCRLQENGEIACARYWPEEGAEVYHIYEVHLVSEHIWCDDYLVRSFYLKNLRTSETRTVTQFHFLSWPQGGVPTQAKALLDFRRKVNKSYRGRSCPIVVHGSAGAGRTGAYILLDLVLGRMNKGAREIDIAATLEHLRDQRAGLVATRQQFEFVLMAVAEEVHAILKALPANQSNEKRDLEATKDGGGNGVLKEEGETTTTPSETATTSAKATTATTEAEQQKDNKTKQKEQKQQQQVTTTTETEKSEQAKSSKATPSKTITKETAGSAKK